MQTTESFLRIRDVLAIIPVSRATWYVGIQAGRYPTPVKLGPRASAWRRSDIDRLVATLSGNGE
ncbi:helix-turn-helix transcriptional regulator [Achromobacter ruhlandii]|uniref:helix-turn-helix transcriptional regulator n=1 Tax=Achromobacter ruhlandii TaxID=72557 RepID=UPI0009E6ECB3|nr:AlpA family phage regulatory protein [Achromobacter ruhlandii]AVC42618.1 AlpA family phage regulatory protein [Achromobacter xylosoxidans]